MKITEQHLRKIIFKALLEENKSSSDLEKIKDFSDKKIIYIYNGKEGPELYIRKPKSAIKRFSKLRSDLQKYLQEKWPYSDVAITYDGITRPMKKALSGDGIRQAGTKHGCGLAHDLKIHLRLPGEKGGKNPPIDREGFKGGRSLARLKKENEKEFKKMMDSLYAAAENIKEKKSSANVKSVVSNLLQKNPLSRYKDIVRNYQGSKPPDKSYAEKFFNALKSQKIEKKPYIEYSMSRNYLMAKNKELVKLIHNFCELPENSDIQWGGAFGGSNTAEGESKGRGVKEFHHFEFTTEAGISELGDTNHPVNKLVKVFGSQLGIDTKNMTSNRDSSKQARGKLYKFLLGYKEEIIAYKKKGKIAKK